MLRSAKSLSQEYFNRKNSLLTLKREKDQTNLKKWFYEIIYRLVSADRIFGSTGKIEDLVKVAIDGRIAPGKAITLGCGCWAAGWY